MALCNSSILRNLEEMERLNEEARSRRPSQTHDWTAYSTFEEIDAWMEEVANDYDWVSIFEVGTTYEGRIIRGLSINPAGQSKVMWIDAGMLKKHYKKSKFSENQGWPLSSVICQGIHAREWAVPAVATYIINELTYNYDSNQEYADSFNWYIIPVDNPDGYAYSWDSVRLFWKKKKKRKNFRSFLQAKTAY